MHHVLVLVHRNGMLDDPCHYFLSEIASCWREDGIRVTEQRGPGLRVEADIVVNHVDLTVVPVDHVAFMRQYPKSLNGYVVDISKREISRHLVRHNDSWDGPVFVKANLNCAGFKESELARKGLMPPKFLNTRNEYQIYKRKEEVPDEVWADRELIVEKFLPEMRSGFYCLRTWVFLGDGETNSLSYSEDPIIKQRSVLYRQPVEEVPDQLRQIREELGFDFGKFDYAIVDGEVVLYDANRTPSLGTFSREQFMPRIRKYAQGIYQYL